MNNREIRKFLNKVHIGDYLEADIETSFRKEFMHYEGKIGGLTEHTTRLLIDPDDPISGKNINLGEIINYSITYSLEL